MNLVIDVGNTRTKLAIFDKKQIKELHSIFKKDVSTCLKLLSNTYKIKKTIISEVSNLSDESISFLKSFSELTLLSHTTKVPFKNLYKTKRTLGLDRIALVVSAVSKYPNKNILVIDAGTCITYDFLNCKSEYYGGAIAPGLAMRYKSLHDYTSKLPKLEQKVPKMFIGNTTEESIHSGVVNGLIQEIKGVISQYQNKYLDLTVVLTGGDTKFLSKQLKSSIFANQNFLLEGLNEILIFNENK